LSQFSMRGRLFESRMKWQVFRVQYEGSLFEFSMRGRLLECSMKRQVVRVQYEGAGC
jgi:hypothetical protein